MKVVTVIGARPQFIKAATVSRVIFNYYNRLIKEIIIHTGQHYDEKMSDIFFKEMEIPNPDYNLGVGGLNHGAMTGQMLEKIEEVLLKEKPDVVLVYGDTNSTLAGALAAAKLHIPVAHVEAGLRSFNKKMPEEINRVLADHVSTILFCPTKQAVENLKKEGFNIINDGNLVDSNYLTRQKNQPLVYNVGDVMYDAALYYSQKIDNNILEKLGLNEGGYLLCTIHRAENTDVRDRLYSILKGLNKISSEISVVIPLHPRTKKIIESDNELRIMGEKLTILDPVGYFDMLTLLKHCRYVATDSGGLQKEAYFFGKYCITLRDETEWVELIDEGVNFLVGADQDKIVDTFAKISGLIFDCRSNLYGDGNAANKIVKIISTYAD